MNKNFFRNELIGMQDELLMYAMKLTANRDEAKELLQETTYRALRCEEMYESGTNFRAWIYTIMNNTFLDQCRHVANERDFLGERESLALRDVTRKHADDDVDQLHDSKELHRIVESLEDDYRIPFYLYASGFKYHEIADKMGIPIGTVKSRIFYGREELQRKLRDFY